MTGTAGHDPGTASLVAYSTYLEHILGQTEPLAAVRVPVLPTDDGSAVGLVTTEPVPAVWDAPGFTNSAMDGFAVAAADLESGHGAAGDTVTLPVSGDIAAGTIGTWSPGTAVRIMTGAPMPEGTDTVVPVEATDHPASHGPLPERVRLPAEWPAGRHVRVRGTDVAAGSELIARGTVLDGATLAALAACGVLSVPVRPRVRVGVVVTGDEVMTLQQMWAADGALADGHVLNSNSVLVAETLRGFGCDVVFEETSSDDPDDFDGCLARAWATGVDLLVTTGGASVGAHDVVRKVLSGVGVEFSAVAMQPAKPQGFGVVDGVVVCALPGNPGAARASLFAIVAPVLTKLGDLPAPRRAAMRVVDGWTAKSGMRQFVPVVIATDGIRPAFAGGVAAHRVRSLARADGLAEVPESVTEVRVGDDLDVIVTRPV